MAVGYGIFGKIGGEYVDLEVIFSTNKNFLQKAVRSSQDRRMRSKFSGVARAAPLHSFRCFRDGGGETKILQSNSYLHLSFGTPLRSAWAYAFFLH
jgi:hypothetical protein